MPGNQKCRSCGAAIVWALTEERVSRMPVDAEPSERGNLVLVVRDHAEPIARTATLFDQPPFYVSHFATCPDAPSWRRRS